MSIQGVQQTSPVFQRGGDNQQAASARLMRRLHTTNRVALSMLWTVAAIVTLIFVSIIVLLLVQGFATIFNPQFYSLDNTNPISIMPELFNTFYILILSELFLFPISLATAIYLMEYAPQGRLVTVIHFAAETLAGVPSIVLGLFGVIAFGIYAHMGTSRLTGALTLLCLNLPLALRLFEDALASVPRELREGGLALGATKWHTIRTIVLPSALPGLITGLILSAGKIIGEAAALIFTMGAFNPSNVYTLNPFIASDTLTIHLWFVKTQGAGSIQGLSSAGATAVSAGSATLLILILLVINLSARGIGHYIQRRITAV
ncbi:MAG: phosphate ABC transporter permease PstA [Ktedonobacteraceae bacterium]